MKEKEENIISENQLDLFNTKKENIKEKNSVEENQLNLFNTKELADHMGL